MESTATNLLDDPVVRAIVVNEREITERKKAEESLHKSEERFQLISRATNDTIWDWDLDTNSFGGTKASKTSSDIPLKPWKTRDIGGTNRFIRRIVIAFCRVGRLSSNRAVTLVR